jgi:hypothetical protein
MAADPPDHCQGTYSSAIWPRAGPAATAQPLGEDSKGRYLVGRLGEIEYMDPRTWPGRVSAGRRRDEALRYHHCNIVGPSRAGVVQQ